MDMDCRIYFHCKKGEIYSFIKQLKEKYDFQVSFLNDYTFEQFDLYIDDNDDADNKKTVDFPDGFLYFNYSMELCFRGDRVKLTNDILDVLWSNRIPAVAACDYEDELYKCGGYKNRDLPWVKCEN